MIDEIVEETYKEMFVRYEKALEKAISMLDILDRQLCLEDDRFTPKTKEQWKEWLMKDD